MDVLVKGRNIVVTPALERYAIEKVERVSKFFDSEGSDSRAEVELVHARNRSVVDAEVAEATLFINGTVLRAAEASEDMYASIDRMADKLERQVRRYRGRQIDRRQGQAKNAPPAPEAAPAPAAEAHLAARGAAAPARPRAGTGEERPARPGGPHRPGRGGEPGGADSEDQAVPDEADGGRGGRAPDGPARPRLLRLHERRDGGHQRGLQAAGRQLRSHRARKIGLHALNYCAERSARRGGRRILGRVFRVGVPSG